MRKGKQLEQIETLQKSLDSLENEWNIEEAKIIDSLAKQCSSKIDSISLLYNAQPIELVTASKIDVFKQCNNDLQELKKIHVFYPVLLLEKKRSLASLKADVSKGSGRREKYDEYIVFEEKELSTICQQHTDYQKTKERCIKNYSVSKGVVDKLLSSLKDQPQPDSIPKKLN